jgi:DUF1009 family protein
VVIKRSKPQQDRRFDLPTVGVGTIDTMHAVKAAVLAVEAGATVLLDREEMLRQANAAGIAVVGISDVQSV